MSSTVAPLFSIGKDDEALHSRHCMVVSSVVPCCVLQIYSCLVRVDLYFFRGLIYTVVIRKYTCRRRVSPLPLFTNISHTHDASSQEP